MDEPINSIMYMYYITERLSILIATKLDMIYELPNPVLYTETMINRDKIILHQLKISNVANH